MASSASTSWLWRVRSSGSLGPNGAGKSTTIRLLTGLFHPTSGTAKVFGLDPIADAVEIHRRVGYLPGELALHPRLTGQQHVDFAARVRGLQDRTFLHELVDRFQVDLERPTRTFSKGNRQKIGILLAVMHRPELVILDEPTSGLDPLMQDEFERLMRELVSTGATVFLSSHELDEVQRVATRVAIIKDGHLVVTDTVEALRRRAPRTIEFSFPRTVDPKLFASIEGVHVVAANGKRITLALRGAVAPVLRVAAELGSARRGRASSRSRRTLPHLLSRPIRGGARSMRADIAVIDLRLRRRALLSYVVGMALYALVIVALYPQFKGDTSLDQLTKNGSTIRGTLRGDGVTDVTERMARRQHL